MLLTVVRWKAYIKDERGAISRSLRRREKRAQCRGDAKYALPKVAYCFFFFLMGIFCMFSFLTWGYLSIGLMLVEVGCMSFRVLISQEPCFLAFSTMIHESFPHWTFYLNENLAKQYPQSNVQSSSVCMVYCPVVLWVNSEGLIFVSLLRRNPQTQQCF